MEMDEERFFFLFVLIAFLCTRVFVSCTHWVSKTMDAEEDSSIQRRGKEDVSEKLFLKGRQLSVLVVFTCANE